MLESNNHNGTPDNITFVLLLSLEDFIDYVHKGDVYVCYNTHTLV